MVSVTKQATTSAEEGPLLLAYNQKSDSKWPEMQMSGLETNFLRNPPGMETSEQLIRTVIVLTKKNDAVQKVNPVITTENRF